jgi:flagellar biosynthesis GTPase FlhF
MYPFIYIQIHMLEVRVKQLEKQAAEKEAAKEAAEKEVAEKKAAGKGAVEKEASEKEAVEKEDEEEEEDQSWRPSGSNDNDGHISPIKFPRVKRWFKCPICFNHLYQHKNSLFFHINYMMMDEFSMRDMVK